MTQNCYACGTDQLYEIYQLETTTVHECKLCESHNLHHKTNKIDPDTYYPPDISELPAAGLTRQDPETSLKRHADSAAFLHLILALTTKKPGSLLDIGCGNGALVNRAAATGINSTGLDSSHDAIKIAKQAAADGTFICGSLNQTRLDVDAVEVATLFDVVEHFSDPEAALALCGQRITSNGLLIATTPNVDGWLKHKQGRDYYHYSHDHQVLFTTTGLRSLAKRAGWKSVSIEDLGCRLRSLDPNQKWYATRKYTRDRSHLLMTCQNFNERDDLDKPE